MNIWTGKVGVVDSSVYREQEPDAAGRAIKEILNLKEENERLKSDLKKKVFENEKANYLIKILEESHADHLEAEVQNKREGEDYLLLTILVIFIWIAYLGTVVYG